MYAFICVSVYMCTFMYVCITFYIIAFRGSLCYQVHETENNGMI